MSSTPTADEIWNDARWVAQAVDPNAGLVRFVQLTSEDYRQESFLDDRILGPSRTSYLLTWIEVAEAKPPQARSDARWIFHIGHVGSTLVSRLLGELDGVLAVREPRALRDLTFFPPEVRNKFIPVMRALMSRSFGSGQTAIVKTTSMVSAIADELAGEQGRALLLYASPRAYLQTILAGDRSQAELHTLASYYLARARALGINWPEQPSPANVAGLVWACEMTALEVAAAALPPESVLWQDFDDFLENPEAGLNNVASFFGLTAGDREIREIARGPLMRRYSKSLDHEFGPETRRQILNEAAAKYGAAIEQALAMLRQAADKTPALARALDRSTSDR